MKEIIININNIAELVLGIIKNRRNEYLIKMDIYETVTNLQLEANRFFSSFYAIEKYETQYNKLMSMIMDAHGKVVCLPPNISLKTRQKAENYVLATYDNLRFWKNRLEGKISHSEWMIHPDKIQREGEIARMFNELQKELSL